MLFASSKYPLPVLNSLLRDDHYTIGMLVTRPDRPVGRKQILTPNPVKIWAMDNNVPFLTPETFENRDKENLIRALTEIKPDLGLVAHFGIKIPKSIYEIPIKQTLNIHFSLLPKYRGGAPLEHTIINGDRETGISILKLTENFDEGDLIYQNNFPLTGNETVDGLYQTLFKNTAAIIPGLLTSYMEGKITPSPQTGTPVPALKKDLGDGKMDWNKTPEELERFIRALNPNPGTWTVVNLSNPQPVTRNPLTKNNKRLKILKAHLENGILIIDEVQLEGRNPISFKQFQQSYPENDLNN